MPPVVRRPGAVARSVYLSRCELGRGAVETLGEHRQTLRRDPREEMVLDVKEHVEHDDALDSVPERPGDVVRAVAVTVDGPYGEERSECLSDGHEPDVGPERRMPPGTDRVGNGGETADGLERHYRALSGSPVRNAGDVGPNRVQRAEDQRPERRRAGARSLGVVVVHAVGVVPEMSDSNRVQRRQHEGTHYGQHDAVQIAPETQIPVKHVMRNAEARQEEHERGDRGGNAKMP